MQYHPGDDASKFHPPDGLHSLYQFRSLLLLVVRSCDPDQVATIAAPSAETLCAMDAKNGFGQLGIIRPITIGRLSHQECGQPGGPIPKLIDRVLDLARGFFP